MARIMIVDDSMVVRKSLTKVLEELGHEVVHESEDGREAVHKYGKVKPDLVTMDITMPVLNGILALKEIMNEDENAKVVMVTSHGEEDLVMDAVGLGAVGYILKPITKEKVEKVLSKILK